jgi:hypothetical protein
MATALVSPDDSQAAKLSAQQIRYSTPSSSWGRKL